MCTDALLKERRKWKKLFGNQHREGKQKLKLAKEKQSKCSESYETLQSFRLIPTFLDKG